MTFTVKLVIFKNLQNCNFDSWRNHKYIGFINYNVSLILFEHQVTVFMQSLNLIFQTQREVVRKKYFYSDNS